VRVCAPSNAGKQFKIHRYLVASAAVTNVKKTLQLSACTQSFEQTRGPHTSRDGAHVRVRPHCLVRARRWWTVVAESHRTATTRAISGFGIGLASKDKSTRCGHHTTHCQETRAALRAASTRVEQSCAVQAVPVTGGGHTSTLSSQPLQPQHIERE
jgi:hypothetical protein